MGKVKIMAISTPKGILGFKDGKYNAPPKRIIYQVKIGDLTYWIERKSGGEFSLFLGATLIMKTANMGEIDDYLKTQF